MPVADEASLQRVAGAQVAAPPTATSTLLMYQVRRYESLDRVLSWPLVEAKKSQWEKSYTLVKRKESLQIAFSILEMLAATYVTFVVIPVITLPAVRTSLKIADHFCSKFVRLVEDSAPRLTDRRNSMMVDGELLVTVIFLPLSMVITLLHRLFEGIAQRVVSLFPPLKEAHRNYDQKGLLGQWITLLLMVYLYLPLQFLSHPTETIQYFLNIPSRIAWMIVEWNVANLVMIINEALEWLQWTSLTFSGYIRLSQRVMVSLVDYWYYVVFKITGLEEILASFLRMVRDYLSQSEGTVTSIVLSLGRSSLAEMLVNTLSTSKSVPVQFIKSVWNEEVREEPRARNRAARAVSRRPEGVAPN